LGIWHYLGDRHTWTYVPRNLSLKLLQWQLPGVFLDNPYGGAINGSLWTLYPEVSCYLLVVLAGLTRLTTRPAFPLVLAAVIAAIFLARQSEGGDLVHSAATLGFPFALGAGAYIYRRFIPVSGLLALALVAGAVLLRTTTLYPLMHALALSYAALWCGFVRIPGLHAYNRLGDYSYGMYIYAFPVEQMVMALHRPLAPIQLALFSFPSTALFAYLSWTWVEAPALAHRHTIGARLRLRRMR
jgi:peptidoglycan/LPS O-acetylase OafA/YrhL